MSEHLPGDDALGRHDAVALAELVRSGGASPVELVEAAIARIEALDPQVSAVIHRRFERALDEAASPELPDGPFRGVPFLLKDLWAPYTGQALTNGNVALRDAMPISKRDSTIVSRPRAWVAIAVRNPASPPPMTSESV